MPATPRAFRPGGTSSFPRASRPPPPRLPDRPRRGRVLYLRNGCGLRPPSWRPGERSWLRLCWLQILAATLEGSFSAVSKPNFASKYAFESSRRDLHNAILCTALQSQFFVKILPNFSQNLQNFGKKQQKNQQFLTDILRLESGARFLVFFLFGVVLARLLFPQFSHMDSKTVQRSTVLN